MVTVHRCLWRSGGILVWAMGLAVWWGATPVRAGSQRKLEIIGKHQIRLLSAGHEVFRGSVEADLAGLSVKRIQSFSFRGRPALRIALEASKQRVEVVLVKPKRKWRLVWAGRTGPLGPDRVSVLVLETGPDRVVLYESITSLQRCDGGKVRLFPRALDPTTWRMRPVSFRPDFKGLPVIRASRKPPAPMSWPAGLSALRPVFASTRQGDGGRADGLGRPTGIDDGNLATFWAESRGGFGRGEFIEVRGPDWPYEITGLVIVPGNASSTRALAADNRLARFLVSFGSEERYVVEIPDDPASGPFPPVYWVLFPKPLSVRCATVTIDSVHSGQDAQAGGRTAIAELHFLSKLDLKGGLDRLARDVSSGRIDGALALSVVRGLGPGMVPRIEAALARNRGGAADFLATALLELAPRRLGAVAARVGRLSRSVRLRFAQRAGRFGDRRLLEKLLSNPDTTGLGGVALRAAMKAGRRSMAASLAASFLEKLPADHRSELMGLLVQTPDQDLSQEQLLGVDPSALKVWIAGQRVLAGMARPDRTASLLLKSWNPRADFVQRFRFLQALGWCAARRDGWKGPAGAAVRKATVGLLSGLIAKEREDLLRWAVVRAAGVGGLGLDRLVKLLEDPAPRVRVASLQSLVEGRWPGAGRALLRCTLQDPSPWVRLECSSLLGRVCPAGIGSVLASQVRRFGLGETVDLATVLARCRYREAWPLLESLLKGYRTGPWKAARAARLLAGAGRSGSVGLMAKALGYASARARPHGPFERLALDLLGAFDELAERGSPTSGRILWAAVGRALSKARTKSIRLRAIEVAGRHCPRGWKVWAAAALRSGDRAEVEAAERLRYQCGHGRDQP